MKSKGILQGIYNVSSGVVDRLNVRIKENDAWKWASVGKITLGEGVLTKIAGFATLFPATYLWAGENAMKLPFVAARGAAKGIARKIGRPLNTPPKP